MTPRTSKRAAVDLVPGPAVPPSLAPPVAGEGTLDGAAGDTTHPTVRRAPSSRFHVRISKGTTAGLPDDILIGPRGILWRECKNQKNKPTPAQMETGEALTAIGQDFAIWRPADWFSGRIKSELAALAGRRTGGDAA